MKKTFAYMAAIAACAVSCAKNEIQEPAAQDPAEVKFSAVSEGCTKTVLDADGKTVLWKKGDMVSILVKGENLAYTAKSDGVSTEFSSEESVTADAGAAWAVYPYSESIGVSEKGVTVEVPSVHNVTSTGFAESSNVAVAYSAELSENTELAFKNVCSYLKLSFKAEQGVNSIVLSSENKDVALAGTVTVKMDAEGLPEIAETGSAVNEVSLKSESALAGTYMIPVLPGAEAKWTLTFTKTDGTVSTTAMGSNAAAFVRNTPLAFDFSGAAINWKAAPTSLTADKVFWSDAHISWAHEGKADSYKVYVDGELKETVSTGEKTAHVTGLENGTKYSVKVAAVYGSEEMESEPVEITTGEIRQLTRNVSPTSVAVGIENRAGALSGNYKPCLYVQLFESEDVTGTPKYEAFVRDNEVLSEGHPFYRSLVAGSGTTYPPFNLAFGGLEPGKDYWFRVKSVKSETYTTYRAASLSGQKRTMESQNGDSEYSRPFKLTTSAKHIPADSEVLFEGFDDCFFSADFINCAVGLMPAIRTKAEKYNPSTAFTPSDWDSWTGPLCFHGLRTGLNGTSTTALNWWTKQTGDTDITFNGTAAKAVRYWVTTADGTLLAPDAVAGEKLGPVVKNKGLESLGDNSQWFMTGNTSVGEGYLVLSRLYGSNDNVNSAPGGIFTPPLSSSLLNTLKATTCTVSFKALAVQGRSGKITVIHLDRNANHRTATTDLWDTVTEIKIANSNGNVDENATEWSAQSETHKWYDYSFDIDLLTGDLVGFTTDGNSCICIDDIKIVLK